MVWYNYIFYKENHSFLSVKNIISILNCYYVLKKMLDQFKACTYEPVHRWSWPHRFFISISDLFETRLPCISDVKSEVATLEIVYNIPFNKTRELNSEYFLIWRSVSLFPKHLILSSSKGTIFVLTYRMRHFFFS